MKFEVNEKQMKRIAKWQKELLKDKAKTGAIGGRFCYQFTLTSIGTIMVVVDDVTGERLDVTDYDTW